MAGLGQDDIENVEDFVDAVDYGDDTETGLDAGDGARSPTGLLDAPDAAESGRGRSPARGKETERGRARDRGSGASGREALAAHDRGRERSGPREQSRHPPERAAWVDRRELFRAVDGRESRGEGRVDERRGSRGAEGDRGPERRAAGREADDRGRGRSVDDARRDSERDPARPRSSGPPLQPGPVPARGLEMGRMRVVPVGVPRGMARAGPSPMRGPVPGPVPEWAPSPRNGPVGRGPGVSPVGMGRGPIPRGVPMGPGPMVRPMGPVVPRTLSRERGPMPVARGPLPMGPRPHPGVGVAPVLRPPERVPSRPLVMVPVAAREAMPRGPGGRPPPAAFRPREAAMRAPMPDVMDRDVARREGGGRAPEPLGGGPVPREVHRSAGRAVAEGAREAAIWARRERDDESRKHERSEGRPPGSGVRSEGAWSKGGHDEATAHVRNDEAQLSPQAPRDAGGRADEGSWCAAAATPPSGRAVEERGDGGRAKESERGAELARGQGQERVREMGEERHRRREGEGRGDVGAGQEPRSSQGPETGRGASGKVEREGQEDFSGRGDRSRSRSRSPRGPLSHREAPTPSMAPGRARSPASPERPGIVGSEAVQLPLPPPPGLGAPSRATVQAEMGRDLPLPPPPAAAGHPSHRDAVLGEAPAHIHAATREAGALPLPPPPGPLPHHDRSPGLGTPLPPPPVREERNDAHGHPPSASGHWERETRARDRRSGDLPLPSPPKGSPMGHVSPGPPLPPPPAPVGSSAGHLPLPPGVARRSVDGPQGTVSLSSGPPTIPPPVAQVTIATRSSADSRDGAGRGRLGMASSNGEGPVAHAKDGVTAERPPERTRRAPGPGDGGATAAARDGRDRGEGSVPLAEARMRNSASEGDRERPTRVVEVTRASRLGLPIALQRTSAGEPLEQPRQGRDAEASQGVGRGATRGEGGGREADRATPAGLRGRGARVSGSDFDDFRGPIELKKSSAPAASGERAGGGPSGADGGGDGAADRTGRSRKDRWGGQGPAPAPAQTEEERRAEAAERMRTLMRKGAESATRGMGGMSGLSSDQKRALLFKRKREGDQAEGGGDDGPGNDWVGAELGDDAQNAKFKRLMGIPTSAEGRGRRQVMSSAQTERVDRELERGFMEGVRRQGGVRRGLGA